jgi:hypothetical protein
MEAAATTSTFHLGGLATAYAELHRRRRYGGAAKEMEGVESWRRK